MFDIKLTCPVHDVTTRYPIIFIASYSHEDSHSLIKWGFSGKTPQIYSADSFYGKYEQITSFQRLLSFLLGFFFRLALNEKTSTLHSAVIIQPNPRLFILSPPKSVYFIVTYSQGRKKKTGPERNTFHNYKDKTAEDQNLRCQNQKSYSYFWNNTHLCVCVYIYIHINVHKHICMCKYIYILKKIKTDLFFCFNATKSFSTV